MAEDEVPEKYMPEAARKDKSERNMFMKGWRGFERLRQYENQYESSLRAASASKEEAERERHSRKRPMSAEPEHEPVPGAREKKRAQSPWLGWPHTTPGGPKSSNAVSWATLTRRPVSAASEQGQARIASGRGTSTRPESALEQRAGAKTPSPGAAEQMSISGSSSQPLSAVSRSMTRTRPHGEVGQHIVKEPQMTGDVADILRKESDSYREYATGKPTSSLGNRSTTYARVPYEMDSPSARIGSNFTPKTRWLSCSNVTSSEAIHQAREEDEKQAEAMEETLWGDLDKIPEAKGTQLAQYSKRSFLPLELFDHEDFEPKSAQGWLCDGPRRAYTPYYRNETGQFQWEKCTAIQYIPDTQRFLVRMDKDGKEKNVTRLRLRFEDEDFALFEERIKRAEATRAETESRIRYKLYVENMPEDKIWKYTPQDFHNLLSRAVSPSVSSEVKERHQQAVLDEVCSTFNVGKKRAVFDYLYLSKEEQVRLAVLALPNNKPPKPAPRVATWGSEYVETENVRHKCQRLHEKQCFHAIPALVSELIAVQQRPEMLPVTSLFTDASENDRPMSLNKWQSCQTHHLSICRERLDTLTSLAAKNAVVGSEAHEELLREVAWKEGVTDDGFEALDFEGPIRKEAHERLNSFARVVEQKMSTQLHELLASSASDVLNFFTHFTIADMNGPMKVTGSLQTEGNGNKGYLYYSPSLENFKSTVTGTLEEIVSVSRQISRLDSTKTADDELTPLVEVTCPLDETVAKARRILQELARSESQGPDNLRESLERYAYLLKDTQVYTDDFLAQERSLEEYEREIAKLFSDTNGVLFACADEEDYGLIKVTAAEAKSHISRMGYEKRLAIQNELVKEVDAANERINTRSKEILQKLQTQPNTPEELDELKQFTERIGSVLEPIEEEIQMATKKIQVLGSYMHEMSDEQIDRNFRTFLWPKQLWQLVQRVKQQLYEEEQSFTKQQQEEKAGFEQHLKQLEQEVEWSAHQEDLDQVHEIADAISSLKDKLEKASEDVVIYQRRDSLFGLEVTKYPIIETMKERLQPYLTLWTTASQFWYHQPGWLDGPFTSIDRETVETNVEKWFKDVVRLAQSNKTTEEGRKVAAKVRDAIGEFKEKVPLILYLRSPGMRMRHWEEVSNIVGQEIKPTEELTLRSLAEKGLFSHMESLQDMSERAEKEDRLEIVLDQMQKEWSETRLSFAKHKDTGTHILKGIDELQSTLEDHITKVQSMRASPHMKPFANRVHSWESKLIHFQELLDEWMNVQVKWIYLLPIFGSGDLKQQLPAEAKQFEKVDITWRSIMADLSIAPQAMAAMDAVDLLERLQTANEELDSVEVGLNSYLEKKRLAFPRFFFLSNEELIQILSEAKDPRRVQPYLSKVFDGINAVEFRDDMSVVAMKSGEGERVAFNEAVDTSASEGHIEKWLIQVEAQMQSSLKSVVRHAIEDYRTKDRTQWLLDWPGQVVLSVAQLYWTKESSEALDNHGVPGLHSYEEHYTAQLSAIVQLIRGTLSHLDRKTIEALVVLDVHARDVLREMISEGVTSSFDFSWQSQLRYYWEGDELVARMVNAAKVYGYEYIGNSSRLVITPLTDRCYRTLMSAIQLNLGGAPEGPAGTGKTETTKDLAKAVAQQCIVFNCSDQLDFQAMGKFFKGLAGSGAWACFDEFNRIHLEVLSVVAQQILDIQRAVAARAQSFTFEGTNMRLNLNCNVFITMNPGYAGRSELPDNLKALFRSVAMVVPEYSLIAEIILYSNGYHEAREASRKIVETYRLCSEQLSAQDHYEYGMRAVITVLRAAGDMKRANPEIEEIDLIRQAIVKVNEPKFLSHDVPLFHGIIKDLFPNSKANNDKQPILRDMIEHQCRESHLQPSYAFCKTVIHLHEIIRIRHGLMLIGGAMGGKSTAYKVLASALSAMHDRGFSEWTTRYTPINPKSLSLDQLYGCVNFSSQEWHDGVLAKAFRNYAEDPSQERKWIVLDGPLDAGWVENLNTVLDDNKKLCLTNGEIIHMNDFMNVIFEVDDIGGASPATVSRCGMVYVDPSDIGWEVLLDSWLETKDPTSFPEEFKPRFRRIASWALVRCLAFVQRAAHCFIEQTDNSLVASFLKLMDALIQKLCQGVALNSTLIDHCLVFALTWTFGAAVDYQGRERFDEFTREVFSSGHYSASLGALGPDKEPPPVQLNVSLPQSSLFDVVIDENLHRFSSWLDRTNLDKPPSPSSNEFHSVIVQTTDNERYVYLLELVLACGYNPLLVGSSGTGKSMYVKQALGDGSDKSLEKTRVVEITFTARSGTGMTQDVIESNLEKRRKGVYGPPFETNLYLFIDDLNMPAKEAYGAQPPLELLRHVLDQGILWERKSQSMNRIEAMQIVGAMSPPGGGRQRVTDRLIRHFNLINFPEVDDNNAKHIFKTLLTTWFDEYKVSVEVFQAVDNLVAASLSAFRATCEHLLPTPAKCHYAFNLRDLSKAFQGVVTGCGKCEDQAAIARLWVHEHLRVFSDRLIEDADKRWFISNLKSQVENHLGMDFYGLFSHLDSDSGTGDGVEAVEEDGLNRLLFCDFLYPEQEPSEYNEVRNMDRLKAVVSQYMEEYNQLSEQRMSLIVFDFALQHICRIERTLRQPLPTGGGGSAVLIGLGGSGKQSLSTLAAYIAGCDLVQIRAGSDYGITSWHEDLKHVMRLAGEQNKSTVLMLPESAIKDDLFMEEVCKVMLAGDIPGLFASEEATEIAESVRPAAKRKRGELSRKELLSFFQKRCKKNMHVIFSLNHVGHNFRHYVRAFPLLSTACTIDYFPPWPTEALRSVSKYELSHSELAENELEAAVDIFQNMHVTMHYYKDRLYEERRQTVYITPINFIELISTFRSLLNERKEDQESKILRYKKGLEKLKTTEHSVQRMQQELEELRPALIRAQDGVDALVERVNEETQEVNKKKDVVEAEEKEAEEKANKAKEIRDQCDAELADVMPEYQNALKALDTLRKKDIDEIRVMTNPPQGVKLVIQAVCHLKGVSPAKIKNSQTGKQDKDYWEPGKKMLSQTRFIESLQRYDKDNVPEEIIQQIKPIVRSKEFEPQRVGKASQAAAGLAAWVKALENYNRVYKHVAPKFENLRNANEELDELQRGLDSKREELRQFQEQLDQLNQWLESNRKRKEEKEKEIENCTTKLERAQKLISGLASEKERWQERITALQERSKTLTGDVLLSAGIIVYLGPYTRTLRNDAIASWHSLCLEKLQCSKNFDINEFLGHPAQTLEWTIKGLPEDSYSITNGLIAMKARRFPLMIDPQGQAGKWIRKLESNLIVTVASEGQMLTVLEKAMREGKPLLIDRIEKHLDPLLDPVLLQQTFRSGGWTCVRLGENIVEWSAGFRLYLTTRLRNPTYSPETSSKVTLINFNITPEALQSQLLEQTVQVEKPTVQQEKNNILQQRLENERELSKAEDKILQVLSTAEGDILEDASAVDVLYQSKELSDELAAKERVAEKTERKIDDAREAYLSVAKRGKTIFFAAADLVLLDPMYYFSLSWFSSMFLSSFRQAGRSDDRITAICKSLLQLVYRSLSRTLFAHHHIVASFLLVLAIRREQSCLSEAEYRFLITGLATNPRELQNPVPNWLSDGSWREVCALASLSRFDGLPESIQKDVEEWQHVALWSSPISGKLPGQWNELDTFGRLLICRAIARSKVGEGVQSLISEDLGNEFLKAPGFELESTMAEALPSSPIVLIISGGSDPASNVFSLAKKWRTKVKPVSLGQGQGSKALATLRECQSSGSWALLQNCHLAESFMPELERAFESIDPDEVNQSFRLVLTTYPASFFPEAILSEGIKLATEPPRGLKPNLLRAISTQQDPGDWHSRRLLYCLCFFHSITRERARYGAIGFNRQYQFTEGDLNISARQLQMFLEGYDGEDRQALPLKGLRYVTAECNYGGRVTDDKDRLTLWALLSDFYHEDALRDPFFLGPSEEYRCPSLQASWDECVTHADKHPDSIPCEVLGLHGNAEIIRRAERGNDILSFLLTSQGSGAVEGDDSAGENVDAIAADLLAKLPSEFDTERVQKDFPAVYEQSFNIVLNQECSKLNRLVTMIRHSLTSLREALKGLIVMSSELEEVANALNVGKVPQAWMQISFRSIKPLASYIVELRERHDMLRAWVTQGQPLVFWISGFFFPQGLITAMKQHFARENEIAVDNLVVDFRALSADRTELASAPAKGIYIDGPFLEGASWDAQRMVLAEQEARVLRYKAPALHAFPVQKGEEATCPEENSTGSCFYHCPLYRTADRRGAISTIGHSSNYVMDVKLPSEQQPSLWVKRGAALIAMLPD